MKKKMLDRESPTYKAWKKLRRDWGNISPVTKVIPNKKKNKKEKYPQREIEGDE